MARDGTPTWASWSAIPANRLAVGGWLGRGSSSGSGKMLGALFNGAGRGAGSSLEGLLGQLRDGGLGAKVASWTGTGDNEDISGAEIAQALPAGLLASAARSCGLREVDAADQIAETLPVAVDELTPEGKIPKEALEELIAQPPTGEPRRITCPLLCCHCSCWATPGTVGRRAPVQRPSPLPGTGTGRHTLIQRTQAVWAIDVEALEPVPRPVRGEKSGPKRRR
ncbi:YidB family protein [Streptomyces sp. NPDC058293]|uniref:YidB family protein n=1 Tax=Streptomyces sp. NPDC058293 TaxID=3346429 RepID=UPI0036E5CCCD